MTTTETGLLPLWRRTNALLDAGRYEPATAGDMRRCLAVFVTPTPARCAAAVAEWRDAVVLHEGHDWVGVS